VTDATVLDQISAISAKITVNGSALSDAAAMSLLSMRVNAGLSATARATLRFVDDGYVLASGSDFALGNAVKIDVQSTTIFSGTVTGAALESGSTGAPEYVITADDESFRLALTHQIIAYESQSASDIITSMASASAMTCSVSASDLSTPVYDYLVQQGSNLAFLESLTRRHNCVWWVKDGVLHAQKAGSTTGDVTVEYGVDLIDFSVRGSGLRPTKVNVNGWDPQGKTDIVGPADDVSSVTSSATFVAGFAGGKPDKTLSASAMTVNESNPNTQGEAEQLATSLSSMMAASAVVARGSVNICPTLAPNVNLTVKNVGPASGSYVVTEVEHTYSARGFYTRFVAGPLRQTLLVDAFAATAPDPGFTDYGLASAIVTNLPDAEHSGMVRVKFTGGDDKLVSAWARVVSVGGGNNRGSVFLPEVNDEVLIGFERGDTRHPVVLGGLFGGKDPMAAGSDVISDNKVAYRRITSRTGAFVELADGESDDKKHIKLSSSSGQVLRIGDDKGEITYASGKPFAIKIGNASIEFDDQGNITVKGAKITVQAQQDVEISANNSATVKGAVKIALQGAQAELKADAQVTVQGGATAALKGGMVQIN
jgi:uncharacterized protein involved in type VI secretion and phage assembly